jgi:hypothetical protein
MFKAVARLNESRVRKEGDLRKAEEYDKSFLSILASV